MTTTTGPTLDVHVHYTYAGDAGWRETFPGEPRPTYSTGILGWSNEITKPTNGPVVLELVAHAHTDNLIAKGVPVTPRIAEHMHYEIITSRPLADEERALFDAARAAGFRVTEYTD